VLTLVAPEPRDACASAQLEQLGALALREGDRVAKAGLGCGVIASKDQEIAL
jgi:hypothetical protein